MKMKLLRGYFRAKGLLPYGITVAAVSFVSFIIAGLVQNAVVCMIIAIILIMIPASQISSLPSKAATATIPLSRVRT